MYVRHLALRDFRSWAVLDVDLTPGRTVIVGSNGYGKTNLVEALWYCATLGSHRVATDAPLVRVGAGSAVASAIVVSEGRELAVDIEITAGRANRARLNRSAVRSAREVLGALRAVLFAPEDLALVRGDPGERRRFLDELAALRRPAVAALRADYDRVLKQRTALLKSAGPGRSRDSAVLETLEIWDGHLAEQGARLMAARLELVSQLAPEVEKAYQVLAPASRPAGLSYRGSVDLPDTADTDSPFDDLRAALLAGCAARRTAELERGVCLVGPHRDDLELRLGDQPAKGFASHGESWSMALALRLAAYELLRTEGSEPVLILDDVFAELDETRRRALAAAVSGAEQVLVTAAVPEDVPTGWEATRIEVSVREDETGRESVVVR